MVDLLKTLNIQAKEQALYINALTHASYAYEHHVENNERLEFLGDAVIELLMSDYLYHKDLDADEGQMTKKRAQSVCEEALVIYATHIELEKYLRLGKGETQKGANKAMIADALEALFGAVYLDLGFQATKKLFKRIIIPHLNQVFNIKDYKSLLQELIQSGGKRNVSYHIVSEKGPSHHREFHALVKLDGTINLGEGRGRTKKEAEQNAAKQALKKGNYDS